MVKLASLPVLPGHAVKAYRLVNSKYPPVELFDDVANAADFETLYALQALTNPRLRTMVGDLGLLPQEQIPFGIPGCAYAVAPFTHLSPDGSRFSDGRFGMLYVADTLDTAIAEVRHHQGLYWAKVPALNYDRFVFRGLCCCFSEAGMHDATTLPLNHPIYAADDYSDARQLGREAVAAKSSGLRYHSVRAPGAQCWGLLTPRLVTSVVQTTHFEMIWNGQILSVNELTSRV
ncbi:MAG: RES family NAD+ phosphorylase [Pseudomonas sp.]|uniref:RES family NAD+ phosphorylase n=1 Tax=Pseudomonas sp. TaxID=306 RepID=UPI0030F351B6